MTERGMSFARSSAICSLTYALIRIVLTITIDMKRMMNSVSSDGFMSKKIENAKIRKPKKV